MKFSHYVERVEKSEEFKKFKKENPDAFLCAGFFVLDYETARNQHHLDYYLPKKKKIATFILDDKIEIRIGEPLKAKDKKKIIVLEPESRLDLDMLKGIVEDEMKNHTVTGEINKIISVFIMMDKRKVWSLNCILSGLNIVNMHVDDASDTILKFEKVGMMDLIKKV